jgi:hypothetical protein
VLAAPLRAETSKLWGTAGERWTSDSRLPDFSFAGYRQGKSPLPTPPVKTNVRDFGAKGDGKTDDSKAFLNALRTMSQGVLFIPAGRYVITQQLLIQHGKIVLRGEGMEKTVLFFPKSLETVVGPGETRSPAGSWSWSGGFISFEGDNGGDYLADIIQPAKRGAQTLQASKTNSLTVGQRVRFVQKNRDGTLGRYLHGDFLPASALLLDKRLVDFSCSIVAIKNNEVTLDRPLRTDVRLAWSPTLYSDLPTVEDVGIESLTISFPPKRYAGHHDEPGFNAISFQETSNGWVKDVHIINSDSGVTLRSSVKFCTIENVTLSAERGRARGGWGRPGYEGHHGFQVADLSQDNLISSFTITAKLIHSISLTSLANGNVFMNGRGDELSFDHHRKAPYENLFTNIDAGNGEHLWEYGGDEDAGPPSAARETFWNIRTSKPIELPEWALLINAVGINTDLPAGLDKLGNWVEPAGPEPLIPANLYESQQKNRR